MNFERYEKAERLEKEGNRDDAILAYSDFIREHVKSEADDMELQEKLALAYNNRGLLYYLKVEFRQAMQDYTQAMQHNPSLAVAYYNRGLVLYRLSCFPEAVADLKKALSLQPDLQPAQQCLQQSLKDLQLTGSQPSCN